MPCKGRTVHELENCNGQAEQVAALLGVGVSVNFTVGAEAADSINVALQVVDGDGNDVTEAYAFFAWLSDTAGAAPTATAPDADVAIGTDGLILLEHTTDIVFELMTEADGDLDLDIGETGIDTWFLNVRLPNGTVVSSATITFA